MNACIQNYDGLGAGLFCLAAAAVFCTAIICRTILTLKGYK